MQNIADRDIPKKIRRLYFLALTAIALLAIGGQVLMQRSLENQQSDSRVINIAGRQRMLSQKICKIILLLHHHRDTLSANTHLSYRTDLNETLALWKESHEGLKNGYLHYVHTPVINNDSIKNMFARVNPDFNVIYASAQKIYAHYRHEKYITSPEILSSLNQILESERHFLSGMDQIVFQYDNEAKRRVSHSQQIERILLFCTLVILLFEGLFVFMPAITQIKQNIVQVLESERKTQLANEELKQVNKLLEETREALLEANNQKHQQEINEQKMRSAYLIEGQEEERKRVALEIHDGLGQMLTALKYGIEKVSDAVAPGRQAQQHLTELRAIIAQTISEARTLSFNLMPAVLSDFGLASALKLLAAQVTSSTNINVSFTTNQKGKRLPKNIEIGLYRVSQEAIHNAVKYAAAHEIFMQLWFKKKYIHLKIMDNGTGFNYDSLVSASEKTNLSQGISNMKQRVFIMNGEITISSAPETGTQIHVKIPASDLNYDEN